jgi:hypothetical protein
MCSNAGGSFLLFQISIKISKDGASGDFTLSPVQLGVKNGRKLELSEHCRSLMWHYLPVGSASARAMAGGQPSAVPPPPPCTVCCHIVLVTRVLFLVIQVRLLGRKRHSYGVTG